MKLFIDECLSNELTKMAIERGHVESTSVAWRKLAGTKDWNLLPILLAGDFTLVTRNSVDFRGRADDPASRGLYKDVELHAGLICLNGPVGMDLELQLELFAIALDQLDELDGELVNRGLEVTLNEQADSIEIHLYDLSKP